MENICEIPFSMFGVHLYEIVITVCLCYWDFFLEFAIVHVPICPFIRLFAYISECLFVSPSARPFFQLSIRAFV